MTSAGVMLLLNFLTAIIVDSVKRNRTRRSNRTSIIRRRQQNRARSVSFSEPLVIPSAKAHKVQSIPSQPGEEIKMVELGSSRANLPPPALAPLPLRPTCTIPPQPMRPAPILKLAAPAKQAVLKPTRVAPAIPTQLKTKINFPTIAPPPPPAPMVRSMSTRQPHRYPFYKTLTIILF
jgi:hypothetical protein